MIHLLFPYSRDRALGCGDGNLSCVIRYPLPTAGAPAVPLKQRRRRGSSPGSRSQVSPLPPRRPLSRRPAPPVGARWVSPPCRRCYWGWCRRPPPPVACRHPPPTCGRRLLAPTSIAHGPQGGKLPSGLLQSNELIEGRARLPLLALDRPVVPCKGVVVHIRTLVGVARDPERELITNPPTADEVRHLLARS